MAFTVDEQHVSGVAPATSLAGDSSSHFSFEAKTNDKDRRFPLFRCRPSANLPTDVESLIGAGKAVASRRPSNRLSFSEFRDAHALASSKPSDRSATLTCQKMFTIARDAERNSSCPVKVLLRRVHRAQASSYQWKKSERSVLARGGSRAVPWPPVIGYQCNLGSSRNPALRARQTS